ncbi:CD209 antigen-like protein E [Polypterus senegalus]|uniref:CD209 antigen-like protein E n=1 Tax=Polypterus senegalus TaxID=55291 RepID=UPI001963BF18|nr:CD209 antigen-like protein E [Polypterus senegalus]
MESENNYRSLENPTEDIYTAAVRLRVQMLNGEPRGSVLHTKLKTLLVKLLLFICGALVAAIVLLVIYYFITIKNEDIAVTRQQNDSFMEQELRILQSEIATLSQRNTELSTKLSALEKQCSALEKSSQSQTCSMCPQGWLLLNSKCYFFSSNKLDWDSSRDNCTSMRGHLVIIESEEEQNFLQNELNRNGLESYWIGLTDSAVEGHFVWVDGRPLDSRLSFWGKSRDGKLQPDNWNQNGQHPNGEDCVQLHMKQNYTGWHDVFCSRLRKRICEMAAKAITFNMRP